MKVLLYLGHTLLDNAKDDCWTDNRQATPSRQAVGIACRRPSETSPSMRVDCPASGEAAGSSRKQRAQSAWTDPCTIPSTPFTHKVSDQASEGNLVRAQGAQTRSAKCSV